MREHSTPDIPYGYCHCGCGQKTEISLKTVSEYGHVRGQPKLFRVKHGKRGFGGYVPSSKGFPDPRHFIPIEQFDERATERFWSKVDRRDEKDCWEWASTIDAGGYGRFHHQRHGLKAHRVAYTLVNGRIPGGLIVCHACDNRRCVNPDHLFLGTPRENSVDASRKNRRTTKLTPDDIRTIRERKRNGETHRSIAAAFGIGHGVVGQIVRREIWSHVD